MSEENENTRFKIAINIGISHIQLGSENESKASKDMPAVQYELRTTVFSKATKLDFLLVYLYIATNITINISTCHKYSVWVVLQRLYKNGKVGHAYSIL